MSYSHLNDITTDTTSQVDITHQKTAAIIWCVALLLCAAYLLISLSYYEYRHRVINGRWLRILCFSSAIFIFLRYVLDLAEIVENQLPFNLCAWVRQAKTVMLGGSVMCTYAVLWCRQRQFYSMPMLKDLSNRMTKFLSFAVIFIMVLSAFIPVIVYVSTRSYIRLENGCVMSYTTVWSALPGVLYYILTKSYHIILIALFIYPLLKYRQIVAERKDHHPGHTSFVEKNGFLKMIKRVRNATIVAVATTSLTGFITLALLGKTYELLLHLIIDVDILVNLLCVIFSFSDWKARLLLCVAPNDIDKIKGTVPV